jgi:hypothetical protein
MTHISGEKSKRGEMRVPKIAIAIFMSMDSIEQNRCHGRKGREKKAILKGYIISK